LKVESLEVEFVGKVDLHYVVLLLPWEYPADAQKWKTKKSQIEAA
jgi:hypothetical protein